MRAITTIDTVLPDPFEVDAPACWWAYRTARLAALVGLRTLHGAYDRLDTLIDQLKVEHPLNLPDPMFEQITARLEFMDLTAGFYRARMVMLRGYGRYVREVHGQGEH